MRTSLVATLLGALVVSALLAGIVLPHWRFGEPSSNILIFVGPQALVLLVAAFVPPKPPPAFLLGVGLATVALLVAFCASVALRQPGNFMVTFLYWFALGSAAATAVGFRFIVTRLPRLSMSPPLLAAATFGACLLGGAALTELLT